MRHTRREQKIIKKDKDGLAIRDTKEDRQTKKGRKRN